MIRRGWIPGCCLAALCVIAVASAVEFFNKGHDFANRCTLCHTTADVKAGDSVSLRPPSEVARQCRVCHTRQAGTTHPVGMAVTARIPEELPLDEFNRMTCLTCHIAHQPSGEMAPPTLLRGDGEADTLCRSCHASEQTMSKRDTHALAFSEAHTPTTLSTKPTAWNLDDRSVVCLSCHEDVGGKDTRTKRWSSHPIGVAYPAGLGRDGDFNAVGTLSKSLRLFDGKLGCETCHNLYSNLDHYLVMSNERSRLCLSCHNK